MTSSYEEALAYLRNLTMFGFNLGLERVRELLSRLGDPQRQMRYVHIGGTNGKGSVASMVAAILSAAGRRPGLYTSPHIHSYRERFRIDGVDADGQELADCLMELKPHIEAMVAEGYEHPTEFEVNTVLAFHYFAKHEVDIVVLEVGMGGEIDATNVIDQAEVVILTNVALEHTEYLGDTLAAIAATKAGIIKAGSQVLSGVEDSALRDLIRDKAASVGAAEVAFLGEDFDCLERESSLEGLHFAYREAGQVIWDGLFLPLQGLHQLDNGALAIRCARLLQVDEEAVRRGLAQTVWPCRLERLPSQPQVLLDGAHNDHGMQVLTAYLRRFQAGRPLVVVIGMLADKERRKAVDLLGPLVDEVIVTKPNNPRAGDFAMIASFFAPYCERIAVREDVAAAVQLGLARREEWGDDALLLITGSLYMVCDARALLLGLEQE